MGMLNSQRAARPVTASAPLVVVHCSDAALSQLDTVLHVAPQCPGCAYVVILQASDLDLDATIADLRRISPLPVRAAQGGLSLEIDQVYVGLASQILALDQDVLHHVQGDAASARETTLPFLVSLTKRDPVRTLAIFCDASDSRSAQMATFLHGHGIPVLRSVDQPLPPGAILDALDVLFDRRSAPTDPVPPTKTPLGEVRDWIEDTTKISLADVRPDVLRTRLLQDQLRLGIFSAGQHIEHLDNDRTALDTLLLDLLPGTTRFYDTPKGLSAFRRKVLKPLSAASNDTAPLRLWLPACAAGSEAYTLTIAIIEALHAAGSTRKLRVIATGLHGPGLDRASSGVYPKDILHDLPRAWRARYFQTEGDTCRVKDTLRGKITFAYHDMLSDPPFMDLDLIVCRHMLSDLRDVPQTRAAKLFQFSLKPGGYVMLGPTDSLPALDGMETIDARWMIFRKSGSIAL